MLPKAWILRARRLYLREADPRDPRASPINGDFPDAPPCLLLSSRDERLRDDSRRLKDRLETFGASVTYFEVSGVQHVWPLHVGRSPEADEAIGQCGEFVRPLLK